MREREKREEKCKVNDGKRERERERERERRNGKKAHRYMQSLDLQTDRRSDRQPYRKTGKW